MNKYEIFEERVLHFIGLCALPFWIVALVVSIVFEWYWLTGVAAFILIMGLSRIIYQRFWLKWPWKVIFRWKA